MARPKSTKPIKDKILSVRLTKEDYVKIKKAYGSIQKYLDIMIKTLPIIILISCKAPEAPIEVAKTSIPVENIVEPEEAFEIETSMYSKMVYGTSSPTYFAYSLDVKCTDTKCYIEGVAHEGQSWQRTVYSFHFYSNTERIELERNGNVAMGRRCSEGYGCYDLILKINESFSMDNGVDCYKANANTSKSQFEQSLNTSTFIARIFSMHAGVSTSNCTPY